MSCLFLTCHDDNGDDTDENDEDNDADDNYFRSENSFDPLEVFEVKVENWQRSAVPRPSDNS